MPTSIIIIGRLTLFLKHPNVFQKAGATADKQIISRRPDKFWDAGLSSQQGSLYWEELHFNKEGSWKTVVHCARPYHGTQLAQCLSLIISGKIWQSACQLNGNNQLHQISIWSHSVFGLSGKYPSKCQLSSDWISSKGQIVDLSENQNTSN